jgi:hypothetical protein
MVRLCILIQETFPLVKIRVSLWKLVHADAHINQPFSLSFMESIISYDHNSRIFKVRGYYIKRRLFHPQDINGMLLVTFNGLTRSEPRFRACVGPMDFAAGRKQLQSVEANGRPLGNSTRLPRWSDAAADGTISAKCQMAGLTVQIGFLTSFSGD